MGVEGNILMKIEVEHIFFLSNTLSYQAFPSVALLTSSAYDDQGIKHRTQHVL